MPRCNGFKPDNTPCERIVGASQTYCYSHDPTRAAERTRNASLAAKSKGPSPEIVEMKAKMRQWMDEVESGELARGDASTLATLAGVYVKYVELERRIRETEELAAEVEELKALVNDRGRGWGASETSSAV